jgi:hypothetical protein
VLATLAIASVSIERNTARIVFPSPREWLGLETLDVQSPILDKPYLEEPSLNQ